MPKEPDKFLFENGWYGLPSRGGPPVTPELIERLLLQADLEDAGILRDK